jgi:CRISPR-associated protein Csh1
MSGEVMLREIINFTKDLNPDLFVRNLKPSEGLHIMVWLNENGKLEKYEYATYKKNQEITPFLKECLIREVNSKCVSMNKALDAKKQIHSCTPFSLAFKLKAFNEQKVTPRIKDYFDSAIKYCKSELHSEMSVLFCRFSMENLQNFLQQIFIDISENVKSENKFKLSDNHYIRLYLGNLNVAEFEEVHHNYLSPKVFNKEEFNVEFNGETYGVSDYLTGYNQKKPFLLHKTATFEINTRVSGADALWLYRFSQLKSNNQIPNPLPIFIDKRELNHAVVEIFNRNEDKKPSFPQILESIYQRYQDIGNYYLINMQGNTIKDFDFVSSFNFKINPPIRIYPLLTDGGALTNTRIDNIFQFEREIVQRIFNNQLVQRTNNGGWRFRYFDEIEYKPQYITAALFHLVITYRKAFYDFIYKSKKDAINSRMFNDIMQSVIIDEIKHDDQHNKSFSIREKLNIWFSLYEFFDTTKSKGEQLTMANQVIKLQEKMQAITEQNDHIETDDEFAFAAGQIIYFLLDQSESGNKTHALLEPFLQKNDCDQFKLAISRVLDRYKHKISFYAKRFNKLAAEVLGYSTDVNIKKLMPLILAGYFSDNVIYRKKEAPVADLE